MQQKYLPACGALILALAATLVAQEVAKPPAKSDSPGPIQNYPSSLSLYPLPPQNSVAIPQIKAPLFSYSLDERVRTEDWDGIWMNWSQTQDVHKQLRLRTRAGGVFSTPNSEAQLTFRLCNEMNKDIASSGEAVATRLNMNEVIFDKLYLTFNKTYIPGVTVNAGRMEWMKNGGFLFLDGTFGDGSRTGYMNMVNIAYHRKGSMLELVGILDPYSDRFLGTVHQYYGIAANHKFLNDWNESAVGAYYTDRNHKNTDFDAFYMLKKEYHEIANPTSSALFQPDKTINTVGGYVNQRLPQGMSVKGEAALQWNKQHAYPMGNPYASLGETSWTAFGGYVNFIKQFKEVKGQPYFLGGYTVFSGSKQTPNATGFDALFGHWPNFSEMYIYTMRFEKSVGYLSNDQIFELSGAWNPIKKARLAAAYYHHQAFDSIQSFNSTIFGSGTNRGDNFQVRADLVANKNWMGHVLWERMNTGDFYAQKGPIEWVRMELTYSFSGHVK